MQVYQDLRARLANGRVIGYSEYTAPEARSSTIQLDDQGHEVVPKTIVFIPGTPGCRKFNPLAAAAAAESFPADVRLIVMERPGIGLSSAPGAAAFTSVTSFRTSATGRSTKRPSHSGSLPTVAAAEAAAALQEASASVHSAGQPPSSAHQADGSQPQPPHPMTDFAELFGDFCKHLRLDRVWVVGYSSGTPYALAAAHAWGKQHWHVPAEAGGSGRTPPGQGLVAGVALVSAISPRFQGVQQGMSPVFRFAYFCTRRIKWLVRWAIGHEAAAAAKDPAKALKDGFKPYTRASPADAAALKRPEVESLFLESYKDGVAHNVTPTTVRETLAVGQPWPFDLPAISSVPVAIWQGSQDVGTTPAMAQYLKENVPGCKQIRVVPDAGHLVLFDVLCTEVVPWLLQQQ
uniref:AB hydrolase-1 domain-containing protein n=1 Tax=Chlamydomonas leiostraca TaxID=1034604 RepID=A0A7S0S349_9CHLO